MTRKIILSGIVGAMLSGCVGGDVGSPSTSGTSAEKVSFVKLSSSAKSLSALSNVKLKVAPGSFAYTTDLKASEKGIRDAVFSSSNQYVDDSLTDFSRVFLIPERIADSARSTFAIDFKDNSLEGLLIDYNYDFTVDAKGGTTSIGHLTSGSSNSSKHPTFIVKNGTLNIGSANLIGVDITTEPTGKIVLKPYGINANFPKYFGLSSSNLTLGQDLEIPEGYEAKIEGGSIKGGKTFVNRGKTKLDQVTLDASIENHGTLTLYRESSDKNSLTIKNLGTSTQLGDVTTVNNLGGTYFAGNVTNFSNKNTIETLTGLHAGNFPKSPFTTTTFYQGNTTVKKPPQQNFKALKLNILKIKEESFSIEATQQQKQECLKAFQMKKRLIFQCMEELLSLQFQTLEHLFLEEERLEILPIKLAEFSNFLTAGKNMIPQKQEHPLQMLRWLI